MHIDSTNKDYDSVCACVKRGKSETTDSASDKTLECFTEICLSTWHVIQDIFHTEYAQGNRAIYKLILTTWMFDSKYPICLIFYYYGHHYMFLFNLLQR